MSTTNLLNWRTLTAAANERKTPASFIKRLLFGREETMATDTIELSKIVRGRHMAPLIKRGNVATKGGRHEESIKLVHPAHIRTVQDFTPGQLMSQRRVGTDLYADAAQVAGTMALRISEALQYMNDDIENREEWMCAQLLRGSLSYEDAAQYAFEIDLERDTDNDIDLMSGNYWEESTGKPQQTCLTVQRLLEEKVSLQATHCILGSEAADAFLNNVNVRADLDNRRLGMGAVGVTQQLQDSGALYLGAPYHGIQIWSYSRQVLDNDGTTLVDLVRPKFAEFVCATPAAEALIYYGAINDMDAIGEGQLLQSKRFSKSWVTKDPSARHFLTETNPLPWIKRPDSTVSVQVVED
jgi:hypothetical protein